MKVADLLLNVFFYTIVGLAAVTYGIMFFVIWGMVTAIRKIAERLNQND